MITYFIEIPRLLVLGSAKEDGINLVYLYINRILILLHFLDI